MTVETRAEKNRRLQAERDAKKLAERIEQLAKNPLRILKLIARAAKYQYDGVSYSVIEGSLDPAVNTEPLFRVTFKFDQGNYTDDHTVYVFGDEWQFETVESEFDSIDAKKAEAERKLKIARDAYDALTQEQRAALNLYRRP